jgi:hypothetical protein
MPDHHKPSDLARAVAEKRRAQKSELLYTRYIRDMPKKPPAPSVKMRSRKVEKHA